MTRVEVLGVALVLTPAILMACEALMVVAWSRSAFQTGRVVVDVFDAWASAGAIPLSAVVSTENGKFKFIEPRLCLFRDKFRPLHTPFALKGTLALHGARVRVRGRLPAVSFAFLVLWLTLWTLVPIGELLLPGMEAGMTPLGLAGFVLVGWVGAGLIYFLSVATEKKRLMRAFEEVRVYLSVV
jgi:hypothetical protein